MVDRTDSEQARADQAQVRFKEGVADRQAAIDKDKPDFRKRPVPDYMDTDLGLHVFQGEVEWVVAKDLDDVFVVLAEHYGAPYYETVGGISEEEARDEWGGPLDDQGPFTIWTERGDWEFQEPRKGEVFTRHWPIVWRDDGDFDDDFFMVKECAPLWYWIQRNGRGFLCSSEY